MPSAPAHAEVAVATSETHPAGHPALIGAGDYAMMAPRVASIGLPWRGERVRPTAPTTAHRPRQGHRDPRAAPPTRRATAPTRRPARPIPARRPSLAGRAAAPAAPHRAAAATAASPPGHDPALAS